VNDLERGVKQVPRADTLDRLATALQLDAETRALFASAAGRRISGATTPVPPMPPAHTAPPRPADRPRLPPLVGRAMERQAITQILAGEGASLLLLSGEPGIGKSRLLQEAGARGRALGWCTIAGGCSRRSGQDPFQPFVDALLRALATLSKTQQRRMLAGCEWLSVLLPELLETGVLPPPRWRLAPEQERRLMFAAVARMLARFTGSAGTLLVLDDLQWAGADAIDLLAYLARGVADAPEASDASDAAPRRIIAAFRSTELAPDAPLALLAADLLTEGIVARLPLAPLARAEAEELLDALLPIAHAEEAGSAAGPQDDRQTGSRESDVASRSAILRQAEGIPFYLVSLARAVIAGGSSGEQSTAIQLPTGIPETVAQSIRSRVALLPAAARDVLTLGAVVGRVLPVALLQAAAPRPGVDLLAACDAAAQAGLLVEYGDDFQFAHDLVRETVLGGLSRAYRIALHSEVADALEREPDHERHAAELTHHLLAANKRERALPYVLRAGEQAAAAYAQTEAEAHYRSALHIAVELGDGAREAEAALRLAQRCVSERSTTRPGRSSIWRSRGTRSSATSTMSCKRMAPCWRSAANGEPSMRGWREPRPCSPESMQAQAEPSRRNALCSREMKVSKARGRILNSPTPRASPASTLGWPACTSMVLATVNNWLLPCGPYKPHESLKILVCCVTL
jgi:predicted ATPase